MTTPLNEIWRAYKDGTGRRYYAARGRVNRYVDPVPPPPVGGLAQTRLGNLRGVSVYTAGVRPARSATVEWYEDWSTGRTTQQVMTAVGASRAPATRVTLSMPAGTFTCSDFTTSLGGVIFGFYVPTNVDIAGNGRDGASATTFLMVPGSSTQAPNVPTTGTNQFCVMGIQNSGPTGLVYPTGVHWQNFAVLGTPQPNIDGSYTNGGHLYNGIRFQHADSGTIENVYGEGFAGNSGAPPGETFGLNIYKSDNFTVRNVEINGIRTRQGLADGPRRNGSVASSPFGANFANNGFIYDSYFHDCQIGMPTFYISNGWQTYRVRSYWNHAGFNHEEDTSALHVDSDIMLSPTESHHFTFENDTTNGLLTVRNPKWNQGAVATTKLVIFQGPRNTTLPDMQSSVPVVLDSAGVSMMSQVLVAQ